MADLSRARWDGKSWLPVPTHREKESQPPDVDRAAYEAKKESH